MTKNRPRSLYEEIAATRAGSHSLAAADLAIQVTRMLYLALTRRGMTQAQLAERLEITEGRVSQVLNGDGNLHIATFGRFMRALGYKIELRAVAAEPGLESIEAQTPRRTREARRAARDSAMFEDIVQGWSPIESVGSVAGHELSGTVRSGGHSSASNMRLTWSGPVGSAQ
jgi:transcriptional regulator with XRE-family HTH domain